MTTHKVKGCRDCPLDMWQFNSCGHPAAKADTRKQVGEMSVAQYDANCRPRTCPLNDGPITIEVE